MAIDSTTLIASIFVASVSLLLVAPCMIYCKRCALFAVRNVGADEDGDNNHRRWWRWRNGGNGGNGNRLGIEMAGG
eukprot:CAMPEP_0203709034 /NCGR_PEP_ID=MMETSP0091-20130426/60819_1 /ASSEMBLY_ACC=CAM_ASM_001089 /TAXON_ID=426623 /ORGANISM="Chaetoceros affinis, Strain CCMP159" /LENGTH=75 /DNA_ID=CAMNT_0050585921 /DNA_START=61 /DNA_END=284 /DNA_ORIENTATION=-